MFFGFVRVKLVINSTPDFKNVSLPPLNNFKIILCGSDRNNSYIDIMLEAEGESVTSINENLHKQIANLKLYVNLYSDNAVDVIQDHSPETLQDKNDYNTRYPHSLNELQYEKLPDYLHKNNTQQHILLQIALEELRTGDIFNAFPKLINWLDDNDGKGSSRFCPIRDSCDHGILDRAMNNVNSAFPNEFEFEENILKRNSQKNTMSLQKHLPEVLDHVKKVFQRNFM